MCEGPESRADADRERPAGADGGEPRGRARARARGRRRARPTRSRFVAGHSLGEYSALAAAGALPLADAARLLKLRGQRHAGGGAGRRGRHGGAARRRARAGARRSPRRRRERRGLRRSPTTTRRARSWSAATRRRSSARSRWPGRARRQARDPAAGERAVPLRADAAGRRRDGGGARREATLGTPAVPLIANVTADAVSDPDDDPAAAGRAGDRRWCAGARACCCMKAQGVDSARRDRRRQGADRPGQAHRPGARPASPSARRPRSKRFLKTL